MQYTPEVIAACRKLIENLKAGEYHDHEAIKFLLQSAKRAIDDGATYEDLGTTEAEFNTLYQQTMAELKHPQ